MRIESIKTALAKEFNAQCDVGDRSNTISTSVDEIIALIKSVLKDPETSMGTTGDCYVLVWSENELEVLLLNRGATIRMYFLDNSINNGGVRTQ